MTHTVHIEPGGGPGLRLFTAGLVFGLGSCGPTLSDRPTDFVGDGSVEVAILCGNSDVGPAQSDATWLKSTVRADLNVEVDWAGVTLVTHGVKVVRRAAGRVVKASGGGSQRTVTYWAVATVPKGSDGVSFGPIEVRYRTAGGETKSFRYGECPLVVKAG